MTDETILADFGNSRLKLGRLYRGELRDVDALPYTESAVTEWIRRAAPARPEQLLICTVITDARLVTIRRQLEHRFACPTHQVETPAAAYGVRVAYTEPHRLGVDRYVAMVGAHRSAPGHKLVVDAGTAMTLDILSTQGEHLGGYIVPGLGLQQDALRRNIATVATHHRTASSLVPGRDTATATAAGQLLALTGAIESACARAAQWVDGPLHVILAGGDAPVIAPQLNVPHTVHPWLVLQGLAVIAAGQWVSLRIPAIHTTATNPLPETI